MSDSEASSPLRKIKRHNCNCEGFKKQINKLSGIFYYKFIQVVICTIKYVKILSDDIKKRDTLIQGKLISKINKN